MKLIWGFHSRQDGRGGAYIIKRKKKTSEEEHSREEEVNTQTFLAGEDDKWLSRNASHDLRGEKMNFLLNKRAIDGDNVGTITTNVAHKPHQHKKQRIASTDSIDSTIPSGDWKVLGLLNEDSGIASTSNDAHSLEFDDHPPVTPPPAIIINVEKAKVKEEIPYKAAERHGFLGKSSKAASSVPSMSINSNATINIHYYPEESVSWSYVIVTIALIVQLLIHGLQLSFGVLLLVIFNNFRKDHIYLIEIG